ncbi:class I SAM-dependent methyltransferase [Phormidesmis sp. 146-35]
MTIANQPTISLGANAEEYSQAMSPEAEQVELRWASEKIRLLIKTLKALPQRERVADIGCRSGGQAAYYQEQAGIREMHGFDIAPVPLAEARKKGIVTHEWISGVSPCPVEDNFFDAIIAGDLIEHLVDTDVFLEELHRVLRPGGYLLITTPNLAWWWSRVRLLLGKVPGGIGSVSFQHADDTAVDRKHLRVSTNSEWVYLFKQHGFKCVSTTGYYYPGLLREPLNTVDRVFTQKPTLANSNLFLLHKSESLGTLSVETWGNGA